MALAAFGGAASYDQTSAAHLDLSDELSAVLNADTFLLGRIPVKGEAQNVDHYWVEDTLNATTVTLNAAAAAGDATLTVVSSTGVQIGALLIDQTLGKQEVMQVTAISGVTLTINRAAGDSGPAAEAHANGALLRIINNVKPEGDESVTEESKTRSRKHNVCEIFKKEVKISGTMLGLDLAGVPNEYQYQLAMRMLELRRNLGMSVYASVKITNSGAGGSDTVYRSLDGLRNFVRNNSTQLTTASEALSESVVNKQNKLCYDQGAVDTNIAVGTADQMVAFSEMYKDKIRLAPSDKARGVFVTKFLTDLGNELDLVIDRWCLPGDLIVGDSNKIRLVPLRGRAMKAEPLAKNGDAMIGMIVGEYTLEVRNAAQSFALHTGLSAR